MVAKADTRTRMPGKSASRVHPRPGGAWLGGRLESLAALRPAGPGVDPGQAGHAPWCRKRQIAPSVRSAPSYGRPRMPPERRQSSPHAAGAESASGWTSGETRATGDRYAGPMESPASVQPWPPAALLPASWSRGAAMRDEDGPRSPGSDRTAGSGSTIRSATCERQSGRPCAKTSIRTEGPRPAAPPERHPSRGRAA